MIITYAECENTYNVFLFVPDTMPWKLVADIDNITAGTAEDLSDYEIDYALKLTAGPDMKETVLLSEEFWGCVPRELDEEEQILELFNGIVAAAAKDFANALSKKESVYDLGATIVRCVAQWKREMKNEIERVDENEE